MKKTLALLLIPAALLVGLLLPRLTVQMEDRYMYRESLSGIEQVDLNTSSGLVTVEKIAMLSASDVSLLYVGVGQHQTAATLSAACWRLLDVVQNNYGVQLLDTDTAEQSQQTAILASQDLTAFLFWEVLFQDADGNELRIYLDDEEALPLAMSYHNEREGGPGPRHLDGDGGLRLLRHRRHRAGVDGGSGDLRRADGQRQLPEDLSGDGRRPLCQAGAAGRRGLVHPQRRKIGMMQF